LRHKSKVLVLVLAAGLAGALFVAQREWWITRARHWISWRIETLRDQPASPKAKAAEAAGTLPEAEATPAAAETGPAPEEPSPEATPATLISQEELEKLPQNVNLLSLEFGGRVERFTSQYTDDKWSAERAIDGDPEKAWSSRSPASYPEEIVFSFFGRQPVLVSSVVINPAVPSYRNHAAKDVEIWASVVGEGRYRST
jgi:hypothetical protein